MTRGGFYDELIDAVGSPRPGAKLLVDKIESLLPGDTHITLAWGRDYGDVTPVKGVVMGGGTHTLAVMVDVSEETSNP